MRLEQEISVSNIKMDRIPLDQKTFDYALLIKSGVEFPPIKVAKRKNGVYEIRDGRHRWTANKLIGKEKILAKFSSRFLER